MTIRLQEFLPVKYGTCILINLTKILSMCLILISQKLVGLSLIGWLIPDVTKYKLLIDVRTELNIDILQTLCFIRLMSIKLQ